MAHFRIVILTPEHVMCFRTYDEVVILLYHSLLDLGHTVDYRHNSVDDHAINIIFGSHLYESFVADSPPSQTIIFNTELLSSCPEDWSHSLLRLSQKFAIIDHCAHNLQWLEASVNHRLELRLVRLRLGYHPKLERVSPCTRRDFDLVYFGDVTPHCEPFLARLASEENLVFAKYSGVYGWTKHNILARSKAVIHLHTSIPRIGNWPALLFSAVNRIPSIVLTYPDSIFEDNQLGFAKAYREDAPIQELAQLLDSCTDLSLSAENAYARVCEVKQNDFTQHCLDCLFPLSSLPAQAPKPQQAWPAMVSSSPLDERWYRLVYPWVDVDPRPIGDYHASEGQFKQLHPNPAFATHHKRPLSLQAIDKQSYQRAENNLDSPLQMLQPRIAVIIHFYGPRMAWLFFAYFVPSLAGLADFYITTSVEETAAICSSLAIEAGISNITVKVIDNRGRDIPSKYICFNAEMQCYDLCLFTHGKESDTAWFHDHNSVLAGSRAVVEAIIHLFHQRPALGLVYPDYMPHLVPFIGWLKCRPLVDQLLGKFGCDTCTVNLLEFPAGGFFWARPAALSVIHSLDLSLNDLPQEPIPLDGTILHAIERLPCLSCEMMGFEWEKLTR